MNQTNTTAELTKEDQQRLERSLAADPYLTPFSPVIGRRLAHIRKTAGLLARGNGGLAGFASGHTFFGLHLIHDQWVLREWAPNAEAVYLIGELSHWDKRPDLAFGRLDANGVWELRLPKSALQHGDLYRLHLKWPGGGGDRIPAWTRRVVQDEQTKIFNAQVWQPSSPYQWQIQRFNVPKRPPLIYEVHVGMAQEEGKVGSYTEFTAETLPRVIAAGYNTLQIMALPEHPYYGSFGYHVSSFFAPSSRFGTPEELKALIDAAHQAGLTVLMDIVHSHAVNNEVEGISKFDGTDYQYFHTGGRGRHHAWDSRCFDYGKSQVLHFLLSNCRYWLDEFHVDGFRFDGVTSMLYHHHGLEKSFTSYDDYYDAGVDEQALCYLALANRVIHTIRPDALTIAEDVSGMPGLASPWSDGGIGFNYRFAMGVPDYWIKLTKDTRDEDWHMGRLWHELNNRRFDEQTISYAESHDQALVGDQTLIFRLIGSAIYDHMNINDNHMGVDRGLALHKMIRLITLATAGHGYLNFMGNEFGHPEWIDFPRQGNNWSHHYARRQWHLMDDPTLKYRYLSLFDRDMIALARENHLLTYPAPKLLWEHDDDNVLIFRRGDLVFAFNFNPTHSFTDYGFPIESGKYGVALDSDAARYGGHGRVDDQCAYFTLPAIHPHHPPHRLQLYLPSRTALALTQKK